MGYKPVFGWNHCKTGIKKSNFLLMLMINITLYADKSIYSHCLALALFPVIYGKRCYDVV